MYNIQSERISPGVNARVQIIYVRGIEHRTTECTLENLKLFFIPRVRV